MNNRNNRREWLHLDWEVVDVTTTILTSLDHGQRTPEGMAVEQLDAMMSFIAAKGGEPAKRARAIIAEMDSLPWADDDRDRFADDDDDGAWMDRWMDAAGALWEMVDEMEGLAREVGIHATNNADAGAWWLSTGPLEPTDDDYVVCPVGDSWRVDPPFRGRPREYASEGAMLADIMYLSDRDGYWPDIWCDQNGYGPEFIYRVSCRGSEVDR